MTDHYAELAELQRRYDDEHATAVARAQETDRVRRRLAAAEDRIAAVGREIAYRIRAELVCCYVYDVKNDGRAPGPMEERQIAKGGTLHEICYWGEAAARLAEDRPDGVSTDGLSDEQRDEPLREMVQLGQELQDPAEPPQLGPRTISASRPELVRPPAWAAMLELAEAARAQHLAEQLRLEAAIVTAIEGASLTIVRTGPVEQVAAHPAAVHRLRTEIFQRGTAYGPLGQIGRMTGLPVIVDDTLPPGEVHLRPHPRPANGTS